MYFILQEMKIDLGDTPIENIFINDYMPYADGTYVKVYIMGYKYARDKQYNFNNETISKNLKLPLSDVLKAWDYWESEGIIVKHQTDDEYNYCVEFINLKQLYIDNVYKFIKNKDNKDSANDSLISSVKGTENKKMMEEIEDMFGRPLKITEKQKIVKWLNDYKMKPEIMANAFSYSINNKKKKAFSYIESVVTAWHDEGINDIDTMVEYLEKRNDRFSAYSRVSKALGFNRTLTEAEMKLVDRWVDEWAFSMEMILKCLDNSTKINNPNLNYFDKILSEWHKNGFKTIEDLKNDKKPDAKAKTSTKETAKTKNKFHNFIQSDDYTGDDLEKIARKRFEKKLSKLGLSMPEEGDEGNE